MIVGSGFSRTVEPDWRRDARRDEPGAWLSTRTKAHDEPREDYGCTRNLEGLSQDQPRQHPDQGVSSHRIERHALLQSAPRRVPDANSAEALVPALQPRGLERGNRERLRVREG